MDMLQEKQRLKELVGACFKDKVTQKEWSVEKVSHNIYKDVVLTLKDSDGKKTELIEGSEDYYKKFERI